MDNKGILVVVSGFSGAGKGTIMNALLEKYQDYELSISATTRAPREGEVEGNQYFFKTREAFEEMIEKKQLIEWAEYVGNYYGTPKSYVETCLQQGKNVLLEIEMQGGMLVKQKFPDAVLIFVTTPSAEKLYERLSGRGTETAEVVHKRLIRASQESEYMQSYDYIIINDELEEAVEQVNSIIKNERSKVSHCSELIGRITKELTELKEGLQA